MKKSQICKFPGCHKEVYKQGALFCGEHERSYKQVIKQSPSLLAVIGLGTITLLTKTIKSKL